MGVSNPLRFHFQMDFSQPVTTLFRIYPAGCRLIDQPTIEQRPLDIPQNALRDQKVQKAQDDFVWSRVLHPISFSLLYK